MRELRTKLVALGVRLTGQAESNHLVHCSTKTLKEHGLVVTAEPSKVKQGDACSLEDACKAVKAYVEQRVLSAPRDKLPHVTYVGKAKAWTTSIYACLGSSMDSEELEKLLKEMGETKEEQSKKQREGADGHGNHKNKRHGEGGGGGKPKKKKTGKSHQG